MAGHQRFTLATDIKVYFCDPQNPWQRGSNENTNGLLCQYFAKGTAGQAECRGTTAQRTATENAKLRNTSPAI
jgi:IS30 family transposase